MQKKLPDLTVYSEEALNTTLWVMLISRQMSNTDTNKLLRQSHGTLVSLSRRLECWRSLKASYKDSAGIKILSLLSKHPPEASWWLHVILQSCEALIFISILLTSKKPKAEHSRKDRFGQYGRVNVWPVSLPSGLRSTLRNRRIYIFHR